MKAAAPAAARPAIPGTLAGRLAVVFADPRRAAVVALVATLPALWPLLRPGFFVSDDGRFHIYRIAALATAWANGVLHPRLFPEFGFGYGQAVLNFYAPLSYWPGALFATLGLSPAGAAELTIALGFLAAALAAYGCANYLWGPLGGILAAIAYTYFPYHLADAYLRGAIPEHFAFIWPPLILWAYTAALRERDPLPALLGGALAWAGLVYTHNLSALLVALALVIYLLLLAGSTQAWRRLPAVAGSLALAVALSAPLWLPFLVESRTVGISLGPSDGYREHLAALSQVVSGDLLYRYRPDAAGVADHPLSWLTPVLIAGVAGLLAWRLLRRRPVPGRSTLVFALALALVSAWMTTAASLPLWLPLAPLLAHLQYPWRFLTLTALGVALAAGALPTSLSRGGPDLPQSERLRAWAAALPALLALALIVVPLPGAPATPLPFSADDAWSPARMWREDAEAGQIGATWTGEFLPLTVQEQRWALGRAPEVLVESPAPAARPLVTLSQLGYQSYTLDLDLPNAWPIRLHQFHLPGWVALLDGRPAPTFTSGELGLVTVAAPAGTSRLSIRFGPTPARTAGALLACLGVIAWSIAAWRRRRQRVFVIGAAALCAVALSLGLNSLGAGQRTWAPRPVGAGGAAVGDVAILAGYDVAPARAARALDVTLYWFALRDVGHDYKAFVHLVNGAGQVVGQHDGDPGGGYSPTTRWRTGELIADRHRLSLEHAPPPGAYTLKAGLYQPQPLQNLPVEPSTPDNRVDLGPLTLPLPR